MNTESTKTAGDIRRTTTGLTQPWRRFIRLRACGRNRLAGAWQQPVVQCCREMGRAG